MDDEINPMVEKVEYQKWLLNELDNLLKMMTADEDSFRGCKNCMGYEREIFALVRVHSSIMEVYRFVINTGTDCVEWLRSSDDELVESATEFIGHPDAQCDCEDPEEMREHLTGVIDALKQASDMLFWLDHAFEPRTRQILGLWKLHVQFDHMELDTKCSD